MVSLHGRAEWPCNIAVLFADALESDCSDTHFHSASMFHQFEPWGFLLVAPTSEQMMKHKSLRCGTSSIFHVQYFPYFNFNFNGLFLQNRHCSFLAGFPDSASPILALLSRLKMLRRLRGS